MGDVERRCHRPDCESHDWELNLHTLSWEATHAAIASVYPEWYIPGDRPMMMRYFGQNYETTDSRSQGRTREDPPYPWSDSPTGPL